MMTETKRPVLTKEDFYPRWEAMEFGNRPRTWQSFEDLKESGYAGQVALRYSEVNSQRKAYYVPAGRAVVVAAQMGGEPSKYRISEQSPLGQVTIQGELTTAEGGLYLAYTDSAVPMQQCRDCLQVATGIYARGILQRHLDPADREDLYDLVRDYPGHVIEFGAYRTRVGVCRRRMMVWEVRAY